MDPIDPHHTLDQDHTVYDSEISSDEDCEHVYNFNYKFVYSSDRSVAHAAGQFLNENLFIPDEKAVKGLKTKRGKKRGVNTPLIRDLVEFFIKSKVHEHGAYLVDSLIDSNPMMKDWECMTDLLLEEPGPKEEPLDDRQETSLIEIMVCCVKQSSTGKSPFGREPNRKQLSAKEAKQVQNNTVKLTEHFIVCLPLLLRKYIAEPEKIANLMSIPQYFDLEIYTTSRQEKNLDMLLKLAQDIVEKHTDAEVLGECSKTYDALCSENYAIHTKCSMARNTLIDALVHKYREATEKYTSLLTAGNEPGKDEIFALTSSFNKVASFSSCHNLGSWNLWEHFLDWLRQASQDKNVPEELVECSMLCATTAVIWDLGKMDKSNPNPEELKILRKRMLDFMGICCDLLLSENDTFEDEAFVTICDLLLLFCKHLIDNPAMESLVFEPDKSLQAKLRGFIQMKVFIDYDDEQDEHTKMEELHKRRNFLVAFCKLVVFNVISTRSAADIFKHYVEFYGDYGDLIKATLEKAWEINKVNCVCTMALSLTKLFNEVKSNEGGDIDRQSNSFSAIKELARRFALLFGSDMVQNRDAVLELHRKSIIFSISPLENPRGPIGPPPNLAFLEILCEFTNKLMKQDKEVCLEYLDSHVIVGMPLCLDEDWQPLMMYRNSLVNCSTESKEKGEDENPQRRRRN